MIEQLEDLAKVQDDQDQAIEGDKAANERIVGEMFGSTNLIGQDGADHGFG